MDSLTITRYSEVQRMEMRSLVNLAGEVIAYYWPMRTFIHHNILHGFEDFNFEEAVQKGQRFLGGRPYLPNEVFREYFRSGRIGKEDVDAALSPLVQEKTVMVGSTVISHLEILRAHLLHGITVPIHGIPESFEETSSETTILDSLTERLKTVLQPTPYDAKVQAGVHADIQSLGRDLTLSGWCDRVLGTRITEQINDELIKWCGPFVDEGHAAWTMPSREASLYHAWKQLAQHDFTHAFLGIQDWKMKIQKMPEHPEEAILIHLETFGLPKALWVDYLSLHLGALAGWTGFIKWRAEEAGYAWQQVYPASLTKYLAVRLFYERELVSQACREELGTEGNYTALLAFMQEHAQIYSLRKAREAGTLNPVYSQMVDRLRYGTPRSGHEVWHTLADRYRADMLVQHDRKEWQSQAWRLLRLATILHIKPEVLTETVPGELPVLLKWLDAFPEIQHGPYWLQAFEESYKKSLLRKLGPNIDKNLSPTGLEQNQPNAVRPLTQAIFCIDVRSEGFRRHLEDIGGYETLGFAGFFAIPFRFRAFGSHHETDQCPVLLKPKHVVREVPRAYQSLESEKHLAGIQFLQTSHHLLHSLKENVLTPYVMVEAMGWLYAIPFIFKTTLATWYKAWSSWLRQSFAPPIGTTLTVNKLTQEEAGGMLAAEQRPMIRLALREQFGLQGKQITKELVETLRQYALEENDFRGPLPEAYRQLLGLTVPQEAAFIEKLRSHYRLDSRGASDRLHRITQTGFTLTEQVNFVETNLRLMGLTKNFARIILLCGHGSTSENNPYESALDCGACGGNEGMSNARTFAVMSNKSAIREQLGERGITIPQDTYFLAGQVDTTTDLVEFFDLEDVPATHRQQLSQLIRDLQEAGQHNSLERLSSFPDVQGACSADEAARKMQARSLDWSQVRPEWGLSRNAAFIVGQRNLTKGLNLEGRVFLHSYDYQGDPTGKLLQVILTAPGVVVQWISMEHYFSTVDPEVYGSGSKMYHNVTGRIGVMFGTQSDLRVGLAWQTVMEGERPYHEAMRPLYIVEAPRDRLSLLIQKNGILQRFFDGRWVHLVALEPEDGTFYQYVPQQGWSVVAQPD
ncbi:MAG: DUF2309 domain-containing protein [Nitrospirales bacterium]